MCILFVALNVHPDYPLYDGTVPDTLHETPSCCGACSPRSGHTRWETHAASVLASNRDEYHDRPTRRAHRWDGEDAHIYAGKDLVRGGTWLGISARGRLVRVERSRFGAPRGIADLCRASAIAARAAGARRS